LLLHSLVADYDIYGTVLGNTAVTTIRRTEDGNWVQVALNDLSHLEGLRSRSVQELEDTDDSRH
jgi:hypothetical protein